MEGVRVAFHAACRLSHDTLAFRVALAKESGEVASGEVQVRRFTDPLPALPAIGVATELLPFSNEILLAVAAALNGPLRPLLTLAVGKEAAVKAEAAVTRDPSEPGFTSIRVIWLHEKRDDGVVVTFKTQAARA